MRGRLLLLLVAIAFAATALLIPHSPSALRAALPAGAAGVAAALAAWTLLTPALFPGTVLAMASGLAFGWLGGGLVACAGGTLGGCVAFALARRGIGARLAARRTGRWALLARFERRGLLGVALLRVAPGVPATALHYACGMTRVRPAAFAGGIALGAAPRALAYAVLGAGLGAAGGPDLALMAGGAGALALLAVPGALAVRRLARRPAQSPAG